MENINIELEQLLEVPVTDTPEMRILEEQKMEIFKLAFNNLDLQRQLIDSKLQTLVKDRVAHLKLDLYRK